MKKPGEPFRFVDQVHLKELTGIKAKNLKELVDILRNAPNYECSDRCVALCFRYWLIIF